MKFSELPKTSRCGRELKMKNAVIVDTTLSAADHGVLTSYVFCKFDDGQCGFGGYVLGRVDGGNITGKKLDYAAEFIVRCLKVAGASEWSELSGRPLRVLHEGLGGTIVAIGHFLNDEWFCPRVEWGD